MSTHRQGCCRLCWLLVQFLRDNCHCLVPQQTHTALSSPSPHLHSLLNTEGERRAGVREPARMKKALNTDNTQRPDATHRSPDSNSPLVCWRTGALATRHVALRGGPRAVGQRLMPILIVIIPSMHLTAGDQASVVSLSTAGRALPQERENLIR